MKITKIDKIKNFGIFSNFTAPTDFDDFLRFNLFYGWNGSGKTTLSKLLYSLQKDAVLPIDLISSEFKISTDQGEITNRNLKQLDNMHVFNEDFISENIDWNDRVKSILLVSKEKITAIEELNIEREAHLKAKKEIEDDKKLEEETEGKLQDLLSLAAKRVKQNFIAFNTKESYYINYDKKKILDFLRNEKENIQSERSVLPDADLKNLIDTIKPNEKNIISFSFKKPDLNTLQVAEAKVSDLLGMSIASGVIERLKNNSDIASWVEYGLKVHEKHGEEKCEFCGNAISPERLQELKKHFSDELSELRKKLEYTKKTLEEDLVFDGVFLDENIFYKDLVDQYNLRKIQIGKEVKNVNAHVESWIQSLSEKISNPSKEIHLNSKVSDDILNNYNREILELESLIKTHNQRVENFDSELNTNQKKLELHYVAEFERSIKYFELQKNSEIRKNWQLEAIKKLNAAAIKLAEYERGLSNETLGAGQFNRTLSRFIGHDEIELRFDERLKGYQIIRKHNHKQAKNLSEGEKTAIAFVYFITKLKEKASLENDIVVLDDPISSFDSNNLFSAYSFIKSELERAGQLFVLTHNFTFFRLIRDWFKGKNGKKKPDGILKDDKARFYLIKVLPSSPRQSVIENIDQSLISYDSEYHFVFIRLSTFKNMESLNLEESFQVANLSRKLLESFLSFKFPKKRSDFKVLFDQAIKKLELPEEERKQKGEKVFKFINKYSHLQTVHFGGDDENNQLGETSNIVKDVLEIIEKNDGNHYSEMVELLIPEAHDNEK